jgi:threonyl-tRNA synthetase
MYQPMEEDGQPYQLKPMNCPFHVLTYKDRLRSYRELPMRWAELGTVYRYEMSGALHGLMRVRGFTQDDAHVFCREEQIEDEVLRGPRPHPGQLLSTFGFDAATRSTSPPGPRKAVGDRRDLGQGHGQR